MLPQKAILVFLYGFCVEDFRPRCSIPHQVDPGDSAIKYFLDSGIRNTFFLMKLELCSYAG